MQAGLCNFSFEIIKLTLPYLTLPYSNPGLSALEADALTTRPTRRFAGTVNNRSATTRTSGLSLTSNCHVSVYHPGSDTSPHHARDKAFRARVLCLCRHGYRNTGVGSLPTWLQKHRCRIPTDMAIDIQVGYLQHTHSFDSVGPCPCCRLHYLRTHGC